MISWWSTTVSYASIWVRCTILVTCRTFSATRPANYRLIYLSNFSYGVWWTKCWLHFSKIWQPKHISTPSKEAYSYSLQIYLTFISCISYHDMDEFISSLHLSHHLSNTIVFYGSCLDCGNQIELSGANNLTSKELTIAYYISLLVKCWNSKKMKLWYYQRNSFVSINETGRNDLVKRV